MIDKAGRVVRGALYRIATNESLFCLIAFLNSGLLGMSVLGWYVEQTAAFGNYIVVPWGMALAVIQLSRRNDKPQGKTRPDIAALFLLLLWIVVPFAIRFGFTFNNLSSWHGYVTAFFGIYVMVSEESAPRRERLLDDAAALFAALAWVLGISLLYFVLNARGFAIGEGDIAFGFSLDSGIPHLCAGVHYNSTGMIALCCMMLCIVGAGRSRNVFLLAYHAIPAVLMAVVVALTQSRTARLAMVVSLAAGIYAHVAAAKKIEKRLIRQLVALCAAVVVMAASYWGSGWIIQQGMNHYVRVNETSIQGVAEADLSAQLLQPLGVSLAEAESPEETEASQNADDMLRPMKDFTFSDRTEIWKNLFRYWAEEPWYLTIGTGVGRIGSQIVEGTIHESNGSVAVHNTYLQFVADFGLIGAALLLIFTLAIVRPVWKVVFSADTPKGYRAMFMLVVACLATGMMESAPLGSLTPMNICLSLALAFLVGQAG